MPLDYWSFQIQVWIEYGMCVGGEEEEWEGSLYILLRCIWIRKSYGWFYSVLKSIKHFFQNVTYSSLTVYTLFAVSLLEYVHTLHEKF